MIQDNPLTVRRISHLSPSRSVGTEESLRRLRSAGFLKGVRERQLRNPNVELNTAEIVAMHFVKLDREFFNKPPSIIKNAADIIQKAVDDYSIERSHPSAFK